MTDSLGTRIKKYEAASRYSLVPNSCVFFTHGTAWVVVDGEYARIHNVRYWADRGSSVDFDQSAGVVYARFRGGRFEALRIVEPSPPRPQQKWVEAERRRAIRDFTAEQGESLDWWFEAKRYWRYSRFRKITNTRFGWRHTSAAARAAETQQMTEEQSGA